MRAAVASAVLVLALTSSFAEAADRPAGEQSAKASSGVKIDLRALTDEGQPVTDLKAEELTLKVNGKPRPIQSLAASHSA